MAYQETSTEVNGHLNDVVTCLTAVKSHVIRFCGTVYERSNKIRFWSIKNSGDVLSKLKSRGFLFPVITKLMALKHLTRLLDILKTINQFSPPEMQLNKANASDNEGPFFAHLNRRLICELIGYSWSVVRPSSSSFTMLKDLLQNRLADQSRISCGAPLGKGNESLFAASGSHDQDGRHAHIW